ncbi:MAG TPA: endonuclease NucS domain-containing protein [Longimicrobium sp.]|jgi:hypothetical protein|uniref:endonuclease NucS domain-containing protein n=1 Tax=Longimicrobium sp. TaxID=2029185 RepID=UPI002EDA35D8
MLENLLVNSPELLQPELVLVGRQVPTAGGPLDLLGVDAEGRLIVFELKRGVLTREAVAQVLDYASDLAAMSNEALARLIEEHSGRSGVAKISDFLEWYSQEFPSQAGPLAERPRMVLVGLGVDERALRVVNFLAETGVPIQLLTFHAFQAGRELFLAQQVESEPVVPTAGTSGGSKEGNRRILHEKAGALGVADFLEESARFVTGKLGNVYVWPHKTLYSFNVADETAEGRATQRYIVSLGPNEQRPGTLRLAFADRVLALSPEVEDAAYGETRRTARQHRLPCSGSHSGAGRVARAPAQTGRGTADGPSFVGRAPVARESGSHRNVLVGSTQ